MHAPHCVCRSNTASRSGSVRLQVDRVPNSGRGCRCCCVILPRVGWDGGGLYFVRVRLRCALQFIIACVPRYKGRAYNRECMHPFVSGERNGIDEWHGGLDFRKIPWLSHVRFRSILIRSLLFSLTSWICYSETSSVNESMIG